MGINAEYMGNSFLFATLVLIFFCIINAKAVSCVSFNLVEEKILSTLLSIQTIYRAGISLPSLLLINKCSSNENKSSAVLLFYFSPSTGLLLPVSLLIFLAIISPFPRFDCFISIEINVLANIQS